ncbi:zinc finger C2HC domain-containing protein 1A [Eucyclogobius newberryi]|uniref:zinc finger C2HC domain-containing protein 1A n=1 Tax=Eucyclogobius newberryi TaxID=166745 RepID=UPI003B5A8F4A
MDTFDDGDILPAQDLVQCNICSRSFLPKVLAKHVKICQKTAAKRRKVFDSSRQRAEGTDISTLKPIKPKSQSSSSSVKAEPPKKPSNWRKKHEDFIAAIRSARSVSQGLKDGDPLPPPPPPSYDPDYIQCPHCQRRFNESAADRHMKFCQEQAARMGNKKEVKKPQTRPQPQQKSLTPVKKSTASPVSTIPSAFSRLPQRAGSGQSAATLGKTSLTGTVRSSSSGLTSPPSGVGMRPRVAGSGYGSVRNAPGAGINKKKVDSCISRQEPNKKHANSNMNEVNGGNNVGNGEKSKFCHDCGTKYPVESAKFCCECGVRRMCI